MPKPSSKKNILPFKSFRRSYKGEYEDDFEAPGLFAHALKTFGFIFKNWKLFGGLLLVVIVAVTLFIGLLNQDSINSVKTTIENSSSELANGNLGTFATSGLVLISTVTTGGLNQNLSEGQNLILIFIFLIIWLVSIHFTRHLLAHKKTTLRKGLYTSLAPLLSTLVVFVVILLEFIPVFLVIIFYNAALKTDFLSTPFYALLFLGFAGLLFLLSAYLVSSSTVALVAVSTPGLYPMAALRLSNDLIFRRRIRLITRLLFLAFVVALVFVVVMLPVIMLDAALKSSFDFLASVPVISFFLLVVTCFNFIYTSVYIYLYYKEMLDYDQR
ncbi:hypothetical protein IJF86_01240 [Candidatus Saccharibacteria bacterium]|nr:hypothetical protein [Candidatus Saccharibacteria bacterium]